MTAYVIPLRPEPQSFSLALAGKEYRLTVRWRDAAEGGWLLDIQSAENSAPILMGLPLVAGCDLLRPFAYLNFGGELRVDGDLPPAFENLGAGVDVLFVTGEGG